MKLNCKTKDFRVPPCGSKTARTGIEKHPTRIDNLYKSKSHYRELMEESASELSNLQQVLYAHGRYSLLLIFQGMDTAGKDGAIRHVMSGVNPQGCHVSSFKQPSQEELAHDFLWRTVKQLPMRGQIGIFNRSYYEEVLIVKAVPSVLAAQRLPQECVQRNNLWQERYRDIVQFEDYLHRNGTRILKFFLHISKDEQRQRLLARARQAEKHWKISSEDLKSRAQWDDFQEVYHDCLKHTSHKAAPWHVVPADDKRNARLIISHILVNVLQDLPLAYPEPDARQLELVKQVRKTLAEEEPDS